MTLFNQSILYLIFNVLIHLYYVVVCSYYLHFTEILLSTTTTKVCALLIQVCAKKKNNNFYHFCLIFVCMTSCNIYDLVIFKLGNFCLICNDSWIVERNIFSFASKYNTIRILVFYVSIILFEILSIKERLVHLVKKKKKQQKSWIFFGLIKIYLLRIYSIRFNSY